MVKKRSTGLSMVDLSKSRRAPEPCEMLLMDSPPKFTMQMRFVCTRGYFMTRTASDDETCSVGRDTDANGLSTWWQAHSARRTARSTLSLKSKKEMKKEMNFETFGRPPPWPA